jgi:hypothetical protein
VTARPVLPIRGSVVRRGGHYYRLAEPDWQDPLDSSYNQAVGGRWNAPAAFPVLYVNDSVGTAHLQVLHKLAGLPYGPEDLEPDAQHDLVSIDVPQRAYLDCVSDAGLALVGLPSSYPRHPNGEPVSQVSCRPVGLRVWDDGLPGIACRSAASGATNANEELAFFDRAGQPRPSITARTSFADWWWGSQTETLPRNG